MRKKPQHQQCLIVKWVSFSASVWIASFNVLDFTSLISGKSEYSFP